MGSSFVIANRHNPSARLRLFCFPHGGAGTSAFKAWPQHLPSDVEVCSIRLPGREDRLLENPIEEMGPLVSALSEAFAPWLGKPFAFFGHSMGALVSFELARALRAKSRRTPEWMFVSGIAAPQVHHVVNPVHLLPDRELTSRLRDLHGTPSEVLTNPELMNLLLPALRADHAVAETYHYTPERPLECPLTAFGGQSDPDVSRADLEAWGRQTSAAFEVVLMQGDHFFLLQEGRLQLFQHLCAVLSSVSKMATHRHAEGA
jgi:medium-chain acyl-[acyl-carrier-protein] hydrolase